MKKKKKKKTVFDIAVIFSTILASATHYSQNNSMRGQLFIFKTLLADYTRMSFDYTYPNFLYVTLPFSCSI